MAIKALTGPQLEPISLAEAKAALRIDHSNEDPGILQLIRSAREYVETRTRRRIVLGNFLYRFDCWPATGVLLLRGPVVSVDAVRYWDADGAQQTWPPDQYQVDTFTEPARLAVAPDVEWPQLQAGRLAAVEVDTVAGWSNPSDVPAVIREAVLMHVAHHYAHRGDDEAPAADTMGAAMDRLIWSARR